MNTERENASGLSKPGSNISVNMSAINKSKTNLEGSIGMETNRSAILENAMGNIYFKDKVILCSEAECDRIWNAQDPNDYV